MTCGVETQMDWEVWWTWYDFFLSILKTSSKFKLKHYLNLNLPHKCRNFAAKPCFKQLISLILTILTGLLQGKNDDENDHLSINISEEFC